MDRLKLTQECSPRQNVSILLGGASVLQPICWRASYGQKLLVLWFRATWIWIILHYHRTWRHECNRYRRWSRSVLSGARQGFAGYVVTARPRRVTLHPTSSPGVMVFCRFRQLSTGQNPAIDGDSAVKRYAFVHHGLGRPTAHRFGYPAVPFPAPARLPSSKPLRRRMCVLANSRRGSIIAYRC